MTGKTSAPPKLATKILAMEATGRKVIDAEKPDTELRLVTRRDGGIDVVLFSRAGADGLVTQVKCDATALVDVLSICLAQHNFQPETYDVVSNMARGDLKKDHNGDHVYTLQSDEINDKRHIANFDKWQREDEYLGRLGNAVQNLEQSRQQAKAAYQKKLTRTMREIRDARM